MDQPSVSMKEYVDILNTDVEAQNSIDQAIGGVFNLDISGSSTSKPPTLDDYPDLTMTQIVKLDPILNVTTTPNLQSRNRNPDKNDTYLHNGFEVATELIDEFNKWVVKDVSSRRGRKSAYSKAKDKFEPQMDFGVVKVSEMDFFNIMIKSGRPWEDKYLA
ncbi:hypothetical protein KY284_005303 [Solanum tuberosum]|nr:hypothetical protein KY284_005303 [Solanum tuberosum]